MFLNKTKNKKGEKMNKKDTLKMLELSNRILEIIEQRSEITFSDFQAIIEAFIMDAIQYKQGEELP